eukprot:scaffold2708_cov257-Pinguiococcus_pyrenoidosus.AAC.1
MRFEWHRKSQLPIAPGLQRLLVDHDIHISSAERLFNGVFKKGCEKVSARFLPGHQLTVLRLKELGRLPDGRKTAKTGQRGCQADYVKMCLKEQLASDVIEAMPEGNIDVLAMKTLRALSMDYYEKLRRAIVDCLPKTISSIGMMANTFVWRRERMRMRYLGAIVGTQEKLWFLEYEERLHYRVHESLKGGSAGTVLPLTLDVADALKCPVTYYLGGWVLSSMWKLARCWKRPEWVTFVLENAFDSDSVPAEQAQTAGLPCSIVIQRSKGKLLFAIPRWHRLIASIETAYGILLTEINMVRFRDDLLQWTTKVITEHPLIKRLWADFSFDSTNFLDKAIWTYGRMRIKDRLARWKARIDGKDATVAASKNANFSDAALRTTLKVLSRCKRTPGTFKKRRRSPKRRSSSKKKEASPLSSEGLDGPGIADFNDLMGDCDEIERHLDLVDLHPLVVDEDTLLEDVHEMEEGTESKAGDSADAGVLGQKEPDCEALGRGKRRRRKARRSF